MACEPSLNLVENVRCALQEFVGVAGNDPGAAILLAIGFLILGAIGLVVAYLGVGAVIDLVRPDRSGPSPRQRV